MIGLGHAGDDDWARICADLQAAMRAGEYEAGVLRAIEAISALMRAGFPRPEGYVDTNELPDRPHVL